MIGLLLPTTWKPGRKRGMTQQEEEEEEEGCGSGSFTAAINHFAESRLMPKAKIVSNVTAYPPR